MAGATRLTVGRRYAITFDLDGDEITVQATFYGRCRWALHSIDPFLVPTEFYLDASAIKHRELI